MAETLGQQLDNVNAAIKNAMYSYRYKNGNREKESAPLSILQKEREYLLSQIAIHGRDYIPGQDTESVPDTSFVSWGSGS